MHRIVVPGRVQLLPGNALLLVLRRVREGRRPTDHLPFQVAQQAFGRPVPAAYLTLHVGGKNGVIFQALNHLAEKIRSQPEPLVRSPASASERRCAYAPRWVCLG